MLYVFKVKILMRALVADSIDKNISGLSLHRGFR